MDGFRQSQRAYEDWLKAQLGPGHFVAADLAHKHTKMKESAFIFLRATCWRWTETSRETAAAFLGAPVVSSLGDAHVENFGLWRDCESRLVWGANDFDEAAKTPYAFDLVRLMTSALLAGGGERSSAEICAAVLEGYGGGLHRPAPFVLERDRLWLRDLFAASDVERDAFWSKLMAKRPATNPPKDFVAALARAMPAGVAGQVIARRQAGAGSLGRARFVACGHLHGAPIAREAKALASSCWTRQRGRSALPDILALANGPHRAGDPCLAVDGDLLVRRLGANTRKLEGKDKPFPLKRRLLKAMGAEIANIHAADRRAAAAIGKDLRSRPAGEFADAVEQTAEATFREWKAFSRS